jgi:hypothetical protein
MFQPNPPAGSTVLNDAQRLAVQALWDGQSINTTTTNWVFTPATGAGRLFTNPNNLTLQEVVDRLMAGTLRMSDTITNSGTANAVLIPGVPYYVDPVAALTYPTTGMSQPQIEAAIRLLQVNQAGAPNSLSYTVSVIDPLQYIDALVNNFGTLSDAQLIDCLMGKDGYKPEATLPFALGLTDWDIEHQLSDIPNDEPNKLFGYRAGLINHPTGTGWQGGRALEENNPARDLEMRRRATYHQR